MKPVPGHRKVKLVTDQKFHLREAFTKSCVFGDRFHRVHHEDGKQNLKMQKNLIAFGLCSFCGNRNNPSLVNFVLCLLCSLSTGFMFSFFGQPSSFLAIAKLGDPYLSFQLFRFNIRIMTMKSLITSCLTERLFNEIKDNSFHKLHGLLPPRNLSTVALRRKHAFNVPFCKTKRLMNSFIMYNAAIF